MKTYVDRFVRASASVLALVVILGAALYAGKPACSPSSVIVTISSTYQDPTTLQDYNAAIRSDGLGDYVDGQAGVAAVIHDCPDGTGDATVNLSTKRPLIVDFRNVIYSNGNTPSWASSPVTGGGFLNIRNVMFSYSPLATYSFTTRFALQLPVPHANYNLRMENPNAVAAFTPNDANANTPCVGAIVNVVHYPATGTTKETWIAWPDSSASNCTAGYTGIQAGTLLYSNTSPMTNVGQFSVPFYITIRRQ